MDSNKLTQYTSSSDLLTHNLGRQMLLYPMAPHPIVTEIDTSKYQTFVAFINEVIHSAELDGEEKSVTNDIRKVLGTICNDQRRMIVYVKVRDYPHKFSDKTNNEDAQSTLNSESIRMAKPYDLEFVIGVTAHSKS